MKMHKLTLSPEAFSGEKAQALYRVFTALQTEEEVAQFLQDLCSPAELQSMIDRWCVVAKLHQGKSYREIHHDTGVSVTTIGRVARSLTMGQGGYALMYQRVNSTVTE